MVVAGGANLTNNCEVWGDLWARDYVVSTRAAKNSDLVGGDTTVRSGNLSTDKATSFGGSLSVGGLLTGWAFRDTDVAGTICAEGHVNDIMMGRTYVPCTSFVEFAQRGFPEITLVPSDWTAEGFTIKSKDGASSWAQDVQATWDISDKQIANYTAQPCYMSGTYAKNPITLTATPTVYDLTSCDFKIDSGVDIRVKADTAIFANSFSFNNQVNFISDDGEQHNVWLIVPVGATGNLATNTHFTMAPPLAAFFYGANSVSISNNSANRGQIYGKSLNISNNLDIEHVPIGVPGVDLGSTGLDVTSSGFNVEVISKREQQQG